MKNNKKKYALVIILILFIAFFSSQCMMTRTNTESKKTVAVILPYTYNKENSRILDAIRDYAHNNSIILDVWHEKSLSSNELSSIIANEEQNHAIGILLIYPENYLTQQEKHYDYNNVLAITATMQTAFSHYAEGNANRQEHQLQYMYTQNFDALLINLVTPSSAASVLNETANHDIPVILFNREADKKDLSISKQTWYVGTAAKKAGAIQADMLQNVWNIDKVNLDRNKNNKLDYILIEGEQTHFDAVRRTNGFLESSQNLPLNQLTNLSADWQRNLSSVKFSKLDTSIIQSAEAIICNNDDMALGVYDYYKQHNLKLPLILGINNSPEMNQKIQAGEIYGTVDNGTNDQISYICKLLNDILNKDTAKYHKIWYSKPFAIEK
ncbi:MAG: substrate-binding domain-containing protein [Anaerobutyricum sp.]